MAAGINLEAAPQVGIGSVCRRQGTQEGEWIVRQLNACGLSLHAFGMKTLGLRRVAPWLSSSDSLAWSFAARRSDPLPGCSHGSCANCATFALQWRDSLLTSLSGRGFQHALFLATGPGGGRPATGPRVTPSD